MAAGLEHLPIVLIAYTKPNVVSAPAGCVTLTRHCGKIYICHLFPYSGLPNYCSFGVKTKKQKQKNAALLVQ